MTSKFESTKFHLNQSYDFLNATWDAINSRLSGLGLNVRAWAGPEQRDDLFQEGITWNRLKGEWEIGYWCGYDIACEDDVTEVPIAAAPGKARYEMLDYVNALADNMAEQAQKLSDEIRQKCQTINL